MTSLVIAAVFAAIVTVVRFFKTLDNDLGRAASTPVVTGAITGLLLRFAHLHGAWQLIAVGVLLTLAALYVRLTGEESEPIDGMLLGGYTGVAAALAMTLGREGGSRTLAECLLAAAVAGFGITFASFHVADRTRRLILDGVTAAAAVLAAFIPSMVHKLSAIDDSDIAIVVASVIPLVAISSVFQQWADVRAELRHEASLGLIDERDVRTASHPLLRFGRAGWKDAAAHREFVRLANKIALRKRQQRSRPEEMARLYQVEIIKLRMQIQEMSRIDHAIDNASAHRAAEEEVPSDTMAHSK